MPELEKLGEDYYAKGLAIGGFVRTIDGYFIFAKKGERSYSKTKIDFIGGILENLDITTGKQLLEEGLRELNEEIGISSKQIEDTYFIGMVLSDTTNIMIVTNTILNISSKKVRDIFNKLSDSELSDLIFIKKSDIKDYLQKLSGYKPCTIELLDI
jgi:predicted NUDIX family phosphoesterase